MYIAVLKEPFLLHLRSFPLDPGLHLQLSQGEVIVHEQSVPARRVDVGALQSHVSGQQVRQPAAGLRAEQLVGAHRVHVIFQRRKGAFRRHTQRLNHVKCDVCSTEAFVPSEPSFCLYSDFHLSGLSKQNHALLERCSPGRKVWVVEAAQFTPLLQAFPSQPASHSQLLTRPQLDRYLMQTE